MMELGFVYRITNLKNKKSYIGETVNIRGRLTTHITNCRSPRLKQEIETFGIDAFEAEILDICIDAAERKRLEEFYIRTFNATDPEYGYNRKPNNGWKGIPHALKRRRLAFMSASSYQIKMSEAALRQWSDPVIREKMKAAAVAGWKKRKACARSK